MERRLKIIQILVTKCPCAAEGACEVRKKYKVPYYDTDTGVWMTEIPVPDGCPLEDWIPLEEQVANGELLKYGVSEEDLSALTDYFNAAVESEESKAALWRMWNCEMGVIRSQKIQKESA